MDVSKSVLVFAVATLAMSAAFFAEAGDAPGLRQGVVPSAQIDAELARRARVEFEMAPVKSAADLAVYLRTADRDSPLAALTPGARQRFLDSLTFNENGLVSYRYDDMARELTASQAYRLLSLFGAQRTTPLLHARIDDEVDAAASSQSRLPGLRMDDHTGYKCVGAHNCYYSEFFVCMTGC